MRVEGEVVGFEFFGGFGVGGIVQQDGTEDGLFGVYVCGESSVEAEVGDGGHISRKSRPEAGCAEARRNWKSGKVP